VSIVAFQIDYSIRQTAHKLSLFLLSMLVVPIDHCSSPFRSSSQSHLLSTLVSSDSNQHFRGRRETVALPLSKLSNRKNNAFTSVRKYSHRPMQPLSDMLFVLSTTPAIAIASLSYCYYSLYLHGFHRIWFAPADKLEMKMQNETIQIKLDKNRNGLEMAKVRDSPAPPDPSVPPVSWPEYPLEMPKQWVLFR